MHYNINVMPLNALEVNVLYLLVLSALDINTIALSNGNSSCNHRNTVHAALEHQ